MKNDSTKNKRKKKYHYGASVAVIEIQRASECEVATLRVIPVRGACNIVVTLDSLTCLEGEVLGTIDGEKLYVREKKNSVTANFTHALQYWAEYANLERYSLGRFLANLDNQDISVFVKKLIKISLCAPIRHDFIDYSELIKSTHSLIALKSY